MPGLNRQSASKDFIQHLKVRAHFSLPPRLVSVVVFHLLILALQVLQLVAALTRCLVPNALLSKSFNSVILLKTLLMRVVPSS